MDYFSWAPEVDLVSNDHYVTAADPEGHRELAFSADLVRGVAGGRPWLLMEQSTSAVNWQPRNVAKRPGELLRNCVQHLAHGADGLLFFQWRASRAGAEKFHAGLVPHAGTDSRVWREVVQLGATLGRIQEIAGSRADNDVAILFDWQAWWACELDSHPSEDVRYLDVAHALHRAVLDQGVGVDVVHPDSDLTGYRLILVPTLYIVTDAAAARLEAAVAGGATALVTYFSGIVDEHDHIRLGGYPGAFRELLGIRVEEFTPLREGEQVRLDDGSVGRRVVRAPAPGGRRGGGDVRRRTRAGRPRRDPPRVRPGRGLVSRDAAGPAGRRRPGRAAARRGGGGARRPTRRGPGSHASPGRGRTLLGLPGQPQRTSRSRSRWPGSTWSPLAGRTGCCGWVPATSPW